MERNISLDYFKIFLSILVVSIHFPITIDAAGFPVLGYVGEFISYGIAKIAVPCFFVINGYFMDITNRANFLKYLKRIFILYAVWTLFYLPFSVGIIQNIPSFFVVIFMGYSHLWYVSALLCGAIILFFLNSWVKNWKIILGTALSLYIVGLYVQSTIDDSVFSLFKYRNFLFTGFPFLAIGYFLRKTQISISKKQMQVITIIATLLLVSEIYLGRMIPDYKILSSLVFVCPVLVFYTIKYTRRMQNFKSDIAYLSSAIYFIHPFVIKLFASFPVANIYVFPYVVILSILFGFMVIQANKTVKVFL